MRNTKGVLPVTGIVPPITKTMHRSFTDSIVSVTRNLFSDEVEVILSVSRFCNKRAGFPIKIFGETLRFSVNLVTLLPGSLWTLVGLWLVGCKIDSHDNLICTYINYVTYRAVFFSWLPVNHGRVSQISCEITWYTANFTLEKCQI